MTDLMLNEDKICTLPGKGFPTIKTWYEKIKELGLEDGYAYFANTEDIYNINELFEITHLITWKKDAITGKPFILICGEKLKGSFVVEENEKRSN